MGSLFFPSDLPALLLRPVLSCGRGAMGDGFVVGVLCVGRGNRFTTLAHHIFPSCMQLFGRLVRHEGKTVLCHDYNTDRFE
jgi:hypothetical protein